MVPKGVSDSAGKTRITWPAGDISRLMEKETLKLIINPFHCNQKPLARLPKSTETRITIQDLSTGIQAAICLEILFLHPVLIFFLPLSYPVSKASVRFQFLSLVTIMQI